MLDRRRQRVPGAAVAGDLRGEGVLAAARGAPAAGVLGDEDGADVADGRASQRGTSRFHCRQRASARPGSCAARGRQRAAAAGDREAAPAPRLGARASNAGRQCDGVAVADQRDRARAAATAAAPNAHTRDGRALAR